MKSNQVIAGRIVLALMLLTPAVVHATELYTLTATASSGQTVTVTGTNMVGLVKNAASSDGAFKSLQGQDTNYTLTYAGQKTLMTIQRNAAGTSATLTIPSTGKSKTFTASDSSKLREQMSDYLKQNVDDAVGKLNKRLNEETKTSFINGNPHAATAAMADDAFYRFGLPAAGPYYQAGWWIKSDGGVYHADGLDGDYANLGFGLDAPFSDTVALSIGFNNEYNGLAGAAGFSFAGLDIGLPLTLYHTPMLEGFIWRVTPFGDVSVTIAPSTLSGGWIFGGGAVSSLSYVTDRWTFTLGDQINYFGGANLVLGTVTLGNSDLDQWITKNGFEAAYQIGTHSFVDGGVTWTHFFGNTGVPDYYSPTVGVGWNFNQASRIRVGARGDLANGYTSFGGEISLTISY